MGLTRKQSNFVSLPFVVAFAWLGLVLVLSLLSRTPRARLNVFQGTATVFFLTAAFRQRRDRLSHQTEAPESDGAYSILLFAGALAACLYGSTVSLYFVGDDFAHLLHAGEPFWSSLREWVTVGQENIFFRPLGFASLFLDQRLFHLSPVGYHVNNLLLHLATVTGVFFFGKELGLSPRSAASASLIFAVLPVHAETVVWISSRFDLLATALAVWSLHSYLRFRRSGQWGDYGRALLLFSLAALSKESAYVVPLLALLLEGLVLQGRPIRPILGFWLVAALIFLYRWQVLGGIGGYSEPSGTPSVLSLGWRTAYGLFIRAPAQLLLGVNWLQPSQGLVVVTSAATAALLLALVFYAKSGSGPRHLSLFALAWIVVSIAPAHPLALIGPGLTNSRILYLAGIGLAILISLLIERLREQWGHRYLLPLLALLLSMGLWHNLNAWRWTCGLSQEFLQELQTLQPSPPPQATFLFADVPATIRGVFFFHNGLPEAVKILYHRQDIYTAGGPGKELPTEGEWKRGTAIRFRWRGETARLLEAAD